MTVQSDNEGNVTIRPRGFHRPESVAERTGEIAWDRFAEQVPPPVVETEPEPGEAAGDPGPNMSAVLIAAAVFIVLALLTSAAAWWVAGLSGAPVWRG